MAYEREKIRKEKYVHPYVGMVMHRELLGFQPTLLSIMFKPLQGSEDAKLTQMKKAMTVLYSKVAKRTFRKPRSETLFSFPFWIVCPDWPVPKGSGFHRDHLANITLNEGLHLHAIALSPPQPRYGTALDVELHDRQAQYVTDREDILRIHADPIDHDLIYTVEYALKSVSRGRIAWEDLIIFPAHHSEFNRLPAGRTPRDEVLAELKRREATVTFPREE